MAGQGCYAQDPQASDSAVPMASPAGSGHAWSEGWYQDAWGYAQGVEEYQKTNKPLVVYINVGWCPYCRRFEKEVLSSPKVEDFMKDMIKVTINPETGDRENAIAAKYGVQGFPSFFLHPPQPGRAVQLYTGVMPEEFMAQIQQALR